MWGKDRREDEFANSHNTATYSVEAGLLMGFTDIALLGVDLNYGLHPSHFFGDGAPLGCKLRNLKLVLDIFTRLRIKAEQAGVSLVTESPLTGPLDDVLPRRACPCPKTSAT